MNEHERYSELLPFYAAGTLNEEQARAVEKHLSNCTHCQEDLALWRAVAVEITTTSCTALPPISAVQRSLKQLRSQQSLPFLFQCTWQLIRIQAPLVRREIWLASALVIALGVISALIIEKAAFLQALAPLVAAACMALLYGPENDPALELTLSVPTSPWQVLLARMVLVFGYNLALTIIAGLGLMALLPGEVLSSLALNWLAPMAFLSALSLMLSMVFGTGNAIAVSYLAWMLRWTWGIENLPFQPADFFITFFDTYIRFWENPLLLLVLAVILSALGLWLAGKRGQAFLKLA